MNLINIGIIISAVLIIILVTLQDRSSGVGGAFGGGDAGGFYQRRRGVERFLFVLTVVSLISFVGLSLLNFSRFGRGTPAVITLPPAATGPEVKVENVQTEGDAQIKIEKIETSPANPTSSPQTNPTPSN